MIRIPKDSCLNQWCHLLSQTEVPRPYQIAVGISLIGLFLKRQVWIDQHVAPDWGWNVYPNQSVMLVGPSGIGKDTAINFAQRFIEEMREEVEIPIIGGTTKETLNYRLVNLSRPAVAYLPVGEMAAFFGSQDYQSGLVQEITDLLSTNERKDVSTKGDLANSGPKIIFQPTLTMHCGSTVEWLHKAMPDGALEGGFLGRFLIVVESLGRKQIPLAKYQATSRNERKELEDAGKEWRDRVSSAVAHCKGLGEILILDEAQQLYTNWYCNRFALFSKAVMPYANRSRDTVLRLAMLMAISRGNFGWIEETDIQFGIDVLADVAKRIDEVVLPPTVEAQAAQEILNSLPMDTKEVMRVFGRKYPLKVLQAAEAQLIMSGQLRKERNLWLRVKEINDSTS